MSIPIQQKALFLRAAKGDFYLGSTNVDKPGPGEVLVRIEATALNPVDWKIQTSGYFITEWPAILGTDSAGVVVALGEGVTKFAVGDKMWELSYVSPGSGLTYFGNISFHQGFFTNRLGTFQEYTIIRADIAAKVCIFDTHSVLTYTEIASLKIPSNLTFDQAASIPLGLATAAIGLYAPTWANGGANLTPPWHPEGKGKFAGQPIVIFGGSSSVGQYGKPSPFYYSFS